jgi:hypothetical protein
VTTTASGIAATRYAVVHQNAHLNAAVPCTHKRIKELLSGAVAVENVTQEAYRELGVVNRFDHGRIGLVSILQASDRIAGQKRPGTKGLSSIRKTGKIGELLERISG